MAHITRVVAHMVAFNMCTNSACTAKKSRKAKTLPQYLTCTPAQEKRTHLVHHLFGLSIANAQASGLVIGAVGAGDQLSKGPRAREPGLQVQLLTGCMI